MKQGGTVIVALGTEPKNFNQQYRFDGGTWFPSTLIFSRLVAMDYGPEFEPKADLATSWQVSDDGKVYTFNLARGVSWHDGKPFTSADVKFTYEQAVVQKGAAVDTLSRIASIETPDETTIRFTLKEPYAPFLAQLAIYPRTMILPKHLYEGVDWEKDPNALKPVGTGPFKFGEYVQGSHFTLLRNDAYFKGAPYLDRVVFQIIPDTNVAIAKLKAGEVHALNNPPPLELEKSLAQSPGVVVDSPPGPMLHFLGFNVKRAPFDNVQVRRAIAMVLDRNDINLKVSQGSCKPQAGTYVEAIGWAYNPNAKQPAFDRAGAERLFDEAGLPKGPNGTRFSFEVTVSQPTWVTTAEVVREQLRQVGVEMRIKQVEDALLRSSLPKLEHDAYIYGNWFGPDPDEWSIYTGTGKLQNYMGYSNPRVDELFQQGVLGLDREQRRAAYAEIQEIMARELPRIALFGSCPYSFAHRDEFAGWFSQPPYAYRMDLSKTYQVK